jgi:Hemerythrin HHE cation binding domain
MTTTAEIVSAITSHHAELQASLSARVDAILTATVDGAPHDNAVADLSLLLEADIVPHARAEEDVLYAAGTDPALRLLVTGMIFEHQTLLALAAELPTTSTAIDAAGVARALLEVFVGHVRRENELLLPALANDRRIDLPALLQVMQVRFATYRAAALG